jgi:hypothetical protein
MIQFRRTLLGDALQPWDPLKDMVDGIQLTKGKDRVKWKIGTSGQFRVKDLYLQMRAEGSFPQKFLWKTKIPMKVRIFIWLMIKCSVLTKDNLLGRGWTRDPHCHFCSKNESIDHLLFSCALAKLIWQVIMCAFHLVRPPKKYLRSIWELDKILSQRPKTFGHVWSLGCLLGALENKK